jgi:hypothetical protein
MPLVPKKLADKDFDHDRRLADLELHARSAVGVGAEQAVWYSVVLSIVAGYEDLGDTPVNHPSIMEFLESVFAAAFRDSPSCRRILLHLLAVSKERSERAAQAFLATAQGYIETYRGHKVFPFAPEDSVICLPDIAHHLSQLACWNGAAGWFYSHAQRAVLVSRQCPPGLELDGLLALASCAYLPSMGLLHGAYGVLAPLGKAHSAMAAVVAEEFGVHAKIPNDVLEAYQRVLLWEGRDLFERPQAGLEAIEAFANWPPADRIVPLDPPEAERLFLEEYCRINNLPLDTFDQREDY